MSASVLAPPLAEPPASALRALLADALPALLLAQGAGLSVRDVDAQRWLYLSEGLAARLGLQGAAGEPADAAQAAAWRAADSTALAQGGVLAGEHSVEHEGQRSEFAVWRWAAAGAGAARWVVTLWLDRSAERQREHQLRQALAQIEQQQQAHDRLRREMADQALRDPASGLHRRAHFDDQLRREVDLSQREHREFAIVFIAVDAPGPKVQALGEAGERAVLEAMGRLIRGGTRAMDTAARHGPRRFAVLLSGVGLATAHARMEGLRRKCATQIVVHEGQELGFSVSMGVASFPHTAAEQGALVQACEAALAEAERRGGNQVTLAAIRFDPA